MRIGDDLIRVTEEHPFWVVVKGWVEAGELQPGDCVQSLTGECQAVESVQRVSVDAWVYNFTVDQAHTYFVGAGQWLVHNQCGAASGKSLTTNKALVMKRLSLSKRQFNKAIHDIKRHVAGNPDMQFDLHTGDVFDQRSGEWVGNLLDYLD